MYDGDDTDHAETATEPPRRSRALLITVGSLVVLFLAFTGFASFWTERLWFGSVGYQDVFTTLLRTKVGLFAVFGLVMALAVGANLLLAYRFRPIFRPSSPEQVSLDRYREAVTPIRTLLLLGVSVVIGLFAGSTASASGATTFSGATASTSAATTPLPPGTSASTSSTCRAATTWSTSRWPSR